MKSIQFGLISLFLGTLTACGVYPHEEIKFIAKLVTPPPVVAPSPKVEAPVPLPVVEAIPADTLKLTDADFEMDRSDPEVLGLTAKGKVLNKVDLEKYKKLIIESDELTHLAFDQQDTYINSRGAKGEVFLPFLQVSSPNAIAAPHGNSYEFGIDVFEATKEYQTLTGLWVILRSEPNAPGVDTMYIRILLSNSKLQGNPVVATILIPALFE